jgi:hypothetical protein
MDNKLLREAACNWKRKICTDTCGQPNLKALFIEKLIYMNDDAIEIVEQFLIPLIKKDYWIHYKGQYIIATLPIEEDNAFYKKVKVLNLNSLHKFSGIRDVKPRATAIFWSAMYPHSNLANVLLNIEKQYSGIHFVKDNDFLRSYSDIDGVDIEVNINTGEYAIY